MKLLVLFIDESITLVRQGIVLLRELGDTDGTSIGT